MTRAAYSAIDREWFPVAQSSIYPFAQGSIEEVVAHLALWGEAVPDGFARVEFLSEILRDRAIAELQHLFAAQQIPFHRLTLPRNASAPKVVSFLIEALRLLPDGVVSLNWSADVFSTDVALEDSLRVLNFVRESLAQFPLRQIWWMPYDFAHRVTRAIPDLNSWFFVRLELTDRDEGEAEALTPPHPSREETQRGVFMVPMPRNPHFVGREETLQVLHAALRDRKNVLLTQAISGLGGIGKTQTACEYAYRHRDEYHAVLWTSAENESTLSAGYRQIARTLDLPEQNAIEAEAIRNAVRLWLQENAGYLLILDNADSLETIRPSLPEQAAGHILLTSRARQFSQLGNVSVLRLEPLPDTEARGYLLQRIHPQGSTDIERDAAEALAQELDGLPLALELAASYMVQQKRDLQTYLREFRERRIDLLRTGTPLHGDYREAVLATWEPNFRAVEERNPAAAELLNLSAFLAPDAIPYEIFLKGAEKLGPTLAAMLRLSGEEALNLIEILLLPANYSLISVDVDDRSFAVHRLVQVAIRARLAETAQRAYIERLVAALITLWPGNDYIYWQQLDRLLPHQLACVEHIKNYKIETFEVAVLYNQAGTYLLGRAEYSKAEPLYRQALAMCQKTLPEDHSYIATSLNALAVLYRNQGRYQEAEPLYQQALVIRQKALPQGHPDIATSLDGLAVLYSSQYRHQEAEQLHHQALLIRQKSLPDGHPDIALSLNNLAVLYEDQGRYQDADPLYEEAVGILEKTLGKEHPSTQTVRRNRERFRQEYKRVEH
jgi:tetratricopeptide (TPR) repeat protein